jgi:hypothetical protein
LSHTLFHTRPGSGAENIVQVLQGVSALLGNRQIAGANLDRVLTGLRND